jgi:hypothetical protein
LQLNLVVAVLDLGESACCLFCFACAHLKHGQLAGEVLESTIVLGDIEGAPHQFVAGVAIKSGERPQTACGML